MDSLHSMEAACAANATAPRISLTDIETNIIAQYEMTAEECIGATATPVGETLKTLSICFLVMRNGFVVIGKSAPASSTNFNAELGRRLAYEDAVRQLWPLMGYALRDRLYEETFKEVDEDNLPGI
jgi:hypothetical protein